MQERIDRAKRTCSYHFDNLAELGRYIDDTAPTWTERDSRRLPKSPSWDLDAGYDESVRMAKEGWLEGARKSQETLKLLPLSAPAAKREITYYGHQPHMGRFVAGDPKHMIHKRPKEGRASVLVLIVPVNATAINRAKCMANFGLAVTHYIAQMERAGTRVEVWGAIRSDSDTSHGTRASTKWAITHTWTVKRASQPLDLAVMSFTIGHPAMFRRLGFALRERSAAPNNPSYGQSVALKHDDVVNCPTGAIILNGMKDANSVAPTPERAVKYVTQFIDKARKGTLK